MAYEHERDEWRSAVRSMTELERQLAVDEPRRALGLAGDITDVRGEVD